MSKALTTMGIDPGYDRVGVGIINNESINNTKYLYSTCIQSDKKDSYLDRILYINNQLEQIIIKYKPDLIVIESLFFAKNAKTAIQVAQARGSILLTCRKYTDNIQDLTPMQIKSSIVGDGHATKDRVAYMTYQILKINNNTLENKIITSFDTEKQKNKTDNINYIALKATKIKDDEIDSLSIALAGYQYYK